MAVETKPLDILPGGANRVDILHTSDGGAYPLVPLISIPRGLEASHLFDQGNSQSDNQTQIREKLVLEEMEQKISQVLGTGRELSFWFVFVPSAFHLLVELFKSFIC